MGSERTYGRINGYQVSIEDYNNDECYVYSSSDAVYKALNMNFVDRSWYQKTIPYSEFDCIWVEKDYQVSEVLKGDLKVSSEDFEKRDISTYMYLDHFAKYKGHKYINHDGVNNKYIYRLSSYDIASQEDGFIMSAPGIFEKTVMASDVEVAYTSKIWCLYKGYIFCPNKGTDDKIRIQTYHEAERCPAELLENLGFSEINSMYMKEVNANEISDIWIINTPEKQFSDKKVEPEIIKGQIIKEQIDKNELLAQFVENNLENDNSELDSQ